MIIDLKRIQLGKNVEDGALWVVEQVPSLVVGGDQTPILRAGNYLDCLVNTCVNKAGHEK